MLDADAELIDERIAVTGDLVATVRELMTAAATSELAPEELEAIRGELAVLAARLAERSRPTPLRQHLDLAAIDRVRAGASWPLWRHNPLAIPLDVRVHDGVASADLVPGPLYEGPPGSMHGGLSAAVLDSLLAVLAQVQRRRVVTVGLQVSYRAAIPLGAPVRLVGRIVGTEGRKTTAVGEILLPASGPGQPETVAVSAEALLVEIPGAPD
ncbi:PaaI family thioesterase [Nocardioides dubius]|uniref:Acyl-coenzyme A thioesterase THEM4 n=1 Tax=Nocardioides dubius TaxID=317019 RepID=A0ABN1TMX8_9ACTN